MYGAPNSRSLERALPSGPALAGVLPPVGFSFYAFVAEKIDVILLNEIEASTTLRRWWMYLCDRVALGIITILGAVFLSVIVLMLYSFAG